MNLTRRDFLAASATTLAVAPLLTAAEPKRRKLVLIAGTPSHASGQHEHNAGAHLVHQCLKGVKELDVVLQLNGYPKDDSILDTADAIFCFADGGKNHPLIQGERPARIGKLLEKGVGLMCMHFGVEVPAGGSGDTFRNWIGGAYEHEYSCNPMWKAEFKQLPKHPIANGVKPFATQDEWYFNIRFRENMTGVTPILTATPTDATRDGPYVYPKGPYRHIQQAKGQAEHVMWCVERTDKGRGVGLTGGHFHANWQNDDFRKLILNALLWISHVEVPAEGVESKVTDEDMKKNLDPKGKK
jgi:type 1 glutamine amidotransferase